MPRENIPIGSVLCKRQCRDNCVFSTCAKFPISSKGMPPQNFSIEQLDQFNLEDNKIPAFSEVGIKPPQPKGLKNIGLTVEEPKPQEPPLPPAKPNDTAQEEKSLPPPSPPSQPPAPPQQPAQHQTQYQPQLQSQFYNQQSNVPSAFMQSQPFNEYTSPISNVQPQTFNAYNAPASKQQMDMAPIAFGPYVSFPQTRAVQCPHCKEILAVESLIPVPDEPHLVDCCSAMPARGAACCQLVTCPENEGLYNQAHPQGQYQGMVQFSQFRSAQSCSQRQMAQVPSLSCQKSGLISDTLNLPASTRALTKNLNTSTCSLAAYPFHGHALCQCSQQQNNRSMSKKSSPRRKEIYHEMPVDDMDITTLDSSELFLDCLRKLTSTSQKLLDNFENAMIRKNTPKPAVKKVESESKYDEQNVHLEPIRVTVPIKLKFLQ